MTFTEFNTLQRIQAEQTLQKHLSLFGFQAMDTPTIHQAGLFLTRAGDKIIDQLLTFNQHGTQLALRPEFTAIAIADYLQLNTTDIKRWQFAGNIYQHQPDTRQEIQERYHISVELIGAVNTLSEAEIIHMALSGLQELGIANLQLTIGHVGLLRNLLSRLPLDRRTIRLLLSYRNRIQEENGVQFVLSKVEELLTLDTIDLSPAPANHTNDDLNTEEMLNVILDSTKSGLTMGGRTRKDISQRLIYKRNRSTQRDEVIRGVEFLQKWGQIAAKPDEAFSAIQSLIEADDTSSQNMLSEWQSLISILSDFGRKTENIIIKPDLAQNWDYYTGTVFGITQNETWFGGGGRYDELATILGSPSPIPAFGFAYYADRFTSLTQIAKQPIYTFSTSDAINPANWLTQLRAHHIALSLVPNKNADLCLQTNGDLTYQNQSYSLSQIDDLISDLKETSNE